MWKTYCPDLTKVQTEEVLQSLHLFARSGAFTCPSLTSSLLRTDLADQRS